MNHDPSDQTLAALFLSRWGDHAIVYGIATWSGIVGHLHRMMGKRVPFSLVAFLTDTLLAGLVGVLIFWLGVWREWPSVVVALSAAIAGHAAPRTMWLLERRFFSAAGLTDDGKDPASLRR